LAPRPPVFSLSPPSHIFPPISIRHIPVDVISHCTTPCQLFGFDVSLIQPISQLPNNSHLAILYVASPVETAAPVAIAPKIYTTAATPSNFLFSHPFGILDSTSTSLTYPFFDDSFASASTSAVLASPPTHYLAERSPTPVLAMEGLTVSSPTLAGASIKRRKSTGCAFEVDANGERRPKKGDDDYVKRPENAFILFRRKCVEDHVQAQEAEAAAVLSATEDGRPRMKKARQADLSKMISQQWRSLSGDARTYWENLAKEKKRQHELLHPDYVYRPQRTKRAGGRPSKKGKAVAESEFEHPDAADSVSFVLPPPVTRTSSTSRKGRGRSYSMPSEYLGGQTVRVPAVPIPVVSPTIPEIPALHEQPTVLTRPRISEPPFDPAGVPRETTVEVSIMRI
jgi:hypothetical protein